MKQSKSRRKCALLLLFCLVCAVELGVQKSFVQAQITPQLTHDLLFTSFTRVQTDKYTLNYLDTTTWKITQIKTDDRPLSLGALSPNGQHLAVLREDQVCLVNRHWQTEFCLPSSLVDIEDQYWMYGSTRVYWEPDSQSFWTTTYQTDLQRLTLVQIGITDGAILKEIPFRDDLPHFADEPLRLSDFSPISMIATLGEPSAIYAVETGEILHSEGTSAYIYWSLSPDGQRVADPGLPGISDLRLKPITVISPDTSWSTTPELVWPKDDWGKMIFSLLSWSNDGRKLAFRQGMVVDGRFRGATFVYFLDTHEVRLITMDYLEAGELVWSPDDSAIAQVVYFGSCDDTDLTILTPDGNIFPVTTDLTDLFNDRPGEHRRIESVTWLPHGWLQMSE